MTTVNPTQSLQALRNNTPKRTCHQLGVCLHQDRACPGECIQAAALQRLAPGVVDGPHRKLRSRSRRMVDGLLVAMAYGASIPLSIWLVLTLLEWALS